MPPSPFPFFAGQSHQTGLSNKLVLSPLPVATNVTAARRADWLTTKRPHYIELGGAGGTLFQTQLMYLFWLFGIFMFAGMFWGIGDDNGMSDGQGWAGVWEGHYVEVWVGPSQWVWEFSWWNLVGTILLLGVGPGMALFLTLNALIDHQRQLRQVLPFRFHRQRREVMLSRWDAEAKRTEVKVFPWEEVCAMVGQGSALTAVGAMTQATLFMGVNDPAKHGSFWAAFQVGTLSLTSGASEWEMIRRYMDEGPDALDEPAAITFDGLIAEYCQENAISREQFSGARRLWWELNGTRLGLLRIKIQTKLEERYLRRFLANHPELAHWSDPLPPEQWAKPSGRLTLANYLLRNEYRKGSSIFNVGDVRTLLGEPIDDSAAHPFYQGMG